MKSNITKFAVAAMIIIALILGVNHFGGTTDITSTAWAKVIENTNQMPWMYATTKVKQYEENSAVSPDGFECWFNIPSKIYVMINANEITYSDYDNKIKYSYSPSDRLLQITTIDDSWEETIGLQSNADLLNMYINFSSLTNDKSRYEVKINEKRAGEYQNRKVDIYPFFIRDNTNKLDTTINFIVDPNTNLIIVMLQKMKDLSGQLLTDAEIAFSYPETGPKDIYEAGAPRDAKIIEEIQENK